MVLADCYLFLALKVSLDFYLANLLAFEVACS